MSTKERPCKIIGGIAGLLGLILIIVSCLFLAKIVSCDEKDDAKHLEVKYEPKPGSGYGSNYKPNYDYDKYGKKPASDRNQRDASQYGEYGPNGKYPPGGGGGYNYPPPFSHKKHKGGEFTRFYACAICGIIFGLMQLIFSGLFCSYVNAKNCKKMATTWCGIHILLVIGCIGIFIAMLTFDREEYAQYYGKQKEYHCFKFNKAFTGIVGLNLHLLFILSCCAGWCAKKSKEGEDDKHKHHDDEKVQFNKQ